MTLFEDTNDLVFLFPGIGVKPFGRENIFFKRYRQTIEPFLAQGSERVGIDLSEMFLRGEIFAGEQLVREVFAYAFSCGTYGVFKEKGVRSKLMAGHSLGVYAALCCSQALTFNDGLQALDCAYRLGKELNGSRTFGAGVIIGLPTTEVEAHIKQAEYTTLCLANINGDASGVYVGYDCEVEKLLRWAEEEGAVKAIELRIETPYHSPLYMREVSNQFRSFLQTLTWHKPICPILSALDHRLLENREDLIEMTSENLCRAINWPKVIAVLVDLEVDRVIECGAGVSLTQHSRFMVCSPRHYNVKNMRRRLDY